jgi:hypothetical protein
MNHDDIIRMAREAGYQYADNPVVLRGLKHFAELVAAAEREACAKVCDNVEKRKWETLVNGGEMYAVGPRYCAAAIRARSE